MKGISLKEGIIKTLKKNQLVIFAIALVLITAGYLNYSMNTEQVAQTSIITDQEEIAGIGDARLVSNDNIIENNSGEKVSEEDKTSENISTTSDEGKSKSEQEAQQTSSKSIEDVSQYFSESKLERNKMYSEMLESYQSILASNGISEEQKNNAQTEISNINKQKNAIMIAENLIKNKGFKDVVIFMNNESVSCIVRAESIETAEIAQIQSIVQRELCVNIENIHISNK